MRNRLVASVAVLFLLGVASGCSSGSASAEKPGQTGEPQATTTLAPTTTTSEPAPPGGLVTPASTSPDGVRLVDGTAPDEHTINIIGGVFIPSTLQIQAGDLVTFKSNPGEAYQLIVGSVQPVTVSQGLLETYRFDRAGTIVASQDVSDETATITVSGGGSTTTTVAGLKGSAESAPARPTGTAIPNSAVVSSSSVPASSTVPASP